MKTAYQARKSTSRLPKGNKKTNNKTGSDPLTGQQLVFSDLGTIESDRVYDKEGSRWLQPIVNNDGFTREAMDQLIDFKIEFEFNTEYIIATATVKGDTRDAWINKVGKDWTERIVFKGEFVYEKSRLIKATLDTYGWQIISQAPPSGVDRYEQGGYAKYVSGNKLSGDGKAISTSGIPYPDDWSPIVKDPSSWQSIFSNHVNPGGYGLDLDIQGNPFSYYVPGLESNTSIVKPYVDQLGGDRFFYSGWEANPLASNLI